MVLYCKNLSYNFRLPLIAFILVLLISGGCKSHKKANRNDIVNNESVLSVKNNKKNDHKEIGEKLAEEAKTWLGTPYRYGGAEKGVGTDCSGLVMMVYSTIAEIALPRNSAQQADFCESLKENKVCAGDLVFFAIGKDKNQVSHVGIMIDKLRFVHASASKGVIVSDMETPYYRRNFKKYGRVPR